MSSLIPTSIPGCQLWLDANDPNANNTAGTNGTAVSTWYDKSGNSRNMTLTGTGVTYANGYQNSLNAISLNGTTILGKVIVPVGTFSSNYTGFAVFRNTKNNNNVMMARTNTGAWGPFDMYNTERYTSVSQNNRIFIGRSSANHKPSNMSLWNFGLNNYAATGATGTYNEYFNGTAATVTLGQTTGLNAADFTDSIYFVGRGGTASEIAGHYCEFLIYNTNLSQTQRQEVEGYLAWKWGIQANLPSTHPFYSNPLSLVHPVPFTYLALDNASNTGLIPQNATVAGSVSYTFIDNRACASFPNSTASYISVPFTTSPQFTISYWFYAAASGYYNPWALSSSSTGNGSFGINPDLNALGPGRQEFYMMFSGGIVNPGTYTYPTASGEWYHVTLSVDTLSGVCKSYYNGIYRNSATGIGTLNNRQFLILGKDGSSARAYSGYLRNFAVFNTVLTETQVSIVYKASLPIHTIPAPLILLRGVNYTGGNTWADNSGYGRVATLEGGTAAINATNNAIVLNGSTSWSFSDIGLGSAYSASVWIKPTDISTWVADDCILTQTFNTGNGERKVPLSIVVTGTTSTTATIAARFWNPNNYQNTPVSISNNTWVHIVVTWNRTNMTTYLNGVQAATSVIAQSVVNGDTVWRIGRRWDTANYIKGEVAEVSLYRTPMNSEQVTAVYKRGLNDIVATGPPAISSISFTFITQTSFIANWAGAYGATSCTYTLDGAPVTPSFSDPYLQTATFTGLTHSTTYSLGITATNATGTVSSSTSITTASPPPTIPVVMASSITSTSFALTWTGGVIASYYQYKLNTIDVTPSTDNGVASKTATFTGLSPSTTYVVEVIAANYAGSTAASSVSVTTLIPPPVAAVVTISSITPTSFVASWTGGTNATSYTYTLDGLTVTPSIDNGLTTKTATFSNLTPSTTYSFVVNPTNAGGPTPTTKSVTTLIPFPTAPAITITALSDTGFAVSYSSTATSFTYLLKKGTVTVVTTPSISGSTATYTGLTSLTEYTLVITGINTTGSTNSAPFPITTLISPPTTPVVTVSSIRDTRFVASWTGGIRATSYTYTLNGSAATPSTDNSLTSNSVTFTGLTASTPYTLIVTAVNSTSTTSSLSTTVTTLIPPPTAPVVSVVPRDTTATISWSGGATATSYTYELSSNGVIITPSIVDNGVSGKTATVTGLIPSTNYSIMVGAINGTGPTASLITNFITLAGPPTRPVVTISSIRDTRFVATWTGGVGASSYTYTLNGNAVTPSIDNGLNGSATFTGLTASTTYALIVIAENATNPTPSTSTSVTTLIPPPTTPAGLTLSAITDTSFIVSWTGGDPAISYTYTLDGTATTPASDDVENDTASFTGLTANTTYVLIVTAEGSTGPTNSAPINVTTLPPRPTAAIVSSNLVKDSSFSISWTGAEGATSYRYTINGTLTIPSVDSGTINRTATFTGLTASTSYDVVVISRNGTGNTNSQIINVQTMPPAPTIPVVTITNTTDVSFTATWTGAIGVISYIYAVNSQFVTPSIDAGLTSRSATFTGLSPSSTYALIVAAVNPTGTTYSVGKTVTTMPPAPTVPVVTLSKVTALSFAARWTGGVGATSYTYTLNDVAATASMNNGLATFTGLVPNTPYSLVVTAVNTTGPTSSAAVSTTTLTSPTKPTGLSASITSASFMVSWTGGADVTSYTYLLNSVPFTPTDNGLFNQTATFLGLSELTTYTCTVIATNSYGIAASDPLTITTSKRPPPTTPLTVLKLQQDYTKVPIVDPVVAAAAIQDALVTNAPATVAAAAMSLGTPVMFTALVNNPNFMGTNLTIPAHAAGLLYNSFENRTTLDVSLPLRVSFPDSAYSVSIPEANANTKLAIDLTVDSTISIVGSKGYAITVHNGVQYLVTPNTVTNGPDNEIHVGDTLAIETLSTTLYFTVADLDIVFIPYKEPVSFICFLGSAPVLTPTGYRRIDRLSVGDVVKTPTGTAIVEAIKTQLCEPSKNSNPYVIPEGVFGANRKLLISPRHKVSVSGHMFEARQLGLEQEVQNKPFTYYNIQITGTQNMIVAGVEVESLKPLVRVTVSRQAFEMELAKMGGMTPEIRARCHFLADGSVSVPSVPSISHS